MRLDGHLFEQFLALPNDAPYDVPADFTQHLERGNAYHNCNLSLKSKELKTESSFYSTGQIETGDAVIFLECLMSSYQPLSPGFKMVVEDYYCTYEPGTKKIIGLTGKYRRLYDLKSQLPTIFGMYFPIGIGSLYTKIAELKERCPIIMAMQNPIERKHVLEQLKQDVNALNAEMVRNNCLIHLARKESSDCKTFEGTGKKPALRIQSALKLAPLGVLVSEKGNTNEILQDVGHPVSPIGVQTPKPGQAGYRGFKGFAGKLDPQRSRSVFVHEPVSRLILPPSSRTTEITKVPQNSRSRSRSRSPSPADEVWPSIYEPGGTSPAFNSYDDMDE